MYFYFAKTLSSFSPYTKNRKETYKIKVHFTSCCMHKGRAAKELFRDEN
jgi:hypothetical protein